MNTSQSIFPMKDQDRAAFASCLLELRDRVEALEAAAQPAKSNHPGTLDSSLKERIKSRLIQSVGSTWEVTTASVLTEVAAWLDTVQKFDAAVLLRLEAER